MDSLHVERKIMVRVFGVPKPQPRTRAFVSKKGVPRIYDPATAEGWKSAIAEALREHIPTVPHEGPVVVRMDFLMPRPKSHYGTGKKAGKLKDNAPDWHVSVPDLDNLEKAVLDACSMLGIWRDDSQVCKVVKTKRYCDPMSSIPPGCILEIEFVGS